MKYHSIFTHAMTSLCLLTSANVLATTDSTKLPVEEQARWFEIEVILFKNISANEEDKESYNARDLSTKTRYAFDLLAPYLQPNIASLKQLLPICGQLKPSFPYNIKPNSLWSGEGEYKNKITLSLDNNTRGKESVGNSTTDNSYTPAMLAKVTSAEPQTSQQQNSFSEAESMNVEKPYQVQYANIELPAYNQFPSNNQIPLCTISADYFQQHLTPEQLKQFSIDGFPVEKLTGRINGVEQWSADENDEITWASDKPYLISQDSLRLKSITNRIKRSRNYAPLLHLGWRQIGETRRKARAMKLYAGQHLNNDYQQALNEQAELQTSLKLQAILETRQQAQALNVSQQTLVDGADMDRFDIVSLTGDAANNSTSLPSQSLLLSELTTANEITNATLLANEISIKEELLKQARQQQLDQLFLQYDLLTGSEINDVEDGVKRIVANLSTDITEETDKTSSAISAQELPVNINAPLQPWYLDGLFKVHLDRYLYINSELNIVEESALAHKLKKPTKTDTAASQPKVISFKQDRRVITGEIHYFDHPHIGMIVQIRRFDPTKPVAEAVSQSKK